MRRAALPRLRVPRRRGGSPGPAPPRPAPRGPGRVPLGGYGSACALPFQSHQWVPSRLRRWRTTLSPAPAAAHPCGDFENVWVSWPVALRLTRAITGGGLPKALEAKGAAARVPQNFSPESPRAVRSFLHPRGNPRGWNSGSPEQGAGGETTVQTCQWLKSRCQRPNCRCQWPKSRGLGASELKGTAQAGGARAAGTSDSAVGPEPRRWRTEDTRATGRTDAQLPGMCGRPRPRAPAPPLRLGQRFQPWKV